MAWINEKNKLNNVSVDKLKVCDPPTEDYEMEKSISRVNTVQNSDQLS